jgi:predicted nucleotide-binding protein
MLLDTTWAIGEVTEFISRCEQHTRDYEQGGDQAFRNPAIQAIHDDVMSRIPIIEEIADRVWPKWRDHLPARMSLSWEYTPMLQVARQLLVQLNRKEELEHNLGERPAHSVSTTHRPPTSIFVVHGHARAELHETVRVLERATGLDVTILHEQPNAGRTILEKFEDHATVTSYAVVLLTDDDVGSKAGSDKTLKPRGRQNVIFELGFFFGKLGRDRVAVLLSEGVEKPSDIDGLVYITLDSSGAWKQALARELQSAKIPVDYSRIP